MPPVLSVVIAIAAVLLVGNLLIIGHELGHYAAARAVGVTARRFFIGFGPTLAQWMDHRGTEWSLALLPIGGYVAFQGEDHTGASRGYAARTSLVRMAIIAGGPATNLALAFVVFAGLLAVQGRSAFLSVATVVVPGSAADSAGIEPGDRIVAADGTPVTTIDGLRRVLRTSAGGVVALQVLRGARRVVLFPRLGATMQDGRTVGLLGIQSKVSIHVRIGFVGTAATAAAQTWGAFIDTIHGVTQAVTTGRGTENFAGVLGITQLAGQAAVAGDSSIFTLIAILSANLALMNLLPVPILDGGALLFCVVELICGRPVPVRLQDFAAGAGVVLMATLFMLSMLHDLAGFGLFHR